MRKTLQLTIALLLIPMLGFSQLNLGLSQPNGLSAYEKYTTIAFGVGPRLLDTEPGNLFISYVDDSPSMDNLTSTTVVEDQYTRIGFNLGITFGKLNGLSHSFAFDISLGEHQGGLFLYSLGWTLPFEVGANYLLVRPAVMAGFGNFGFDVGTLENNAGFIQIGDKQYFSESLDLHLSSQTFVWGPKVDLNFIINDKINLFANIAYDLASKNDKPKLIFSAPDSSDEGQSELEIDGNNPFVTYNDAKITTLPYEVSGLRLTVGVGYAWMRD